MTLVYLHTTVSRFAERSEHCSYAVLFYCRRINPLKAKPSNFLHKSGIGTPSSHGIVLVCVCMCMCVLLPIALADQEPLKCSTTDLNISLAFFISLFTSAFTKQ